MERIGKPKEKVPAAPPLERVTGSVCEHSVLAFPVQSCASLFISTGPCVPVFQRLFFKEVRSIFRAPVWHFVGDQ